MDVTRNVILGSSHFFFFSSFFFCLIGSNLTQQPGAGANESRRDSVRTDRARLPG